MANITFINDCYTKDNLHLYMLHSDPGTRDLCVVFSHGMTGNLTEYFAMVWADKFCDNGIGLLSINNRGHNIMNNTHVKDSVDSVRIGTAYEKFEDCVYDFECGIEKAKELGYKKVILAGHSLGTNKSVYYYSQKKPDVAGIILASMPDMIAYELLYGEEYYNNMLAEAKANVEAGNPDKLVEVPGVSWVPMSSGTYVNWYSPGSNLDNIPVVRNPEKWDQIAELDVPVLTFSGGDEEDMYHHMDLIGEKAVKCPDFEWYIIPDTDHCYTGKEDECADLVFDWIKRKFL